MHNRYLQVGCFLLTVTLFAAFVPFSAAESLQPEAWDSQIKPREAVDTNPDPRIVEVSIEAKIARVTIEPGLQVDAWTYNGDIPGPLIRTRVGDRLIVHFTNNLPKPTTVHWHGLRIPIQMDGVPGSSQPDVQPGGSFTYDFVVPDAGLFWYHPHVMSALQVGYGLYGALMVEDLKDPIAVSDELVLVLSDIAIDENGNLQRPDTAGPLGLAFGLEGNHVLANGRKNRQLIARAGAPLRWRIVNAAKSKYIQLDIAEATGKPFTVIGGDGGLQEYPTQQETLVIAPGERVDAIVTPSGVPGTELTVRAIPYDRGYGSEYLPIENLFTIALADLPPVTTSLDLSVTRSITPLERAGATTVHIDLTLVQAGRTVEYRLNDVPSARVEAIPATIGETQIWTITNHTKWSHPIHLHGFFFQVLDKNGDPLRPLAWKDTVDVPYDQTLSFVVKYDERPGSWMFHCHVLDHAEGGLMTTVELSAEPSADPKPAHSGHHSQPQNSPDGLSGRN
jgi:FtsP/CotA-like multicopper oxidase with cupredoxin domain